MPAEFMPTRYDPAVVLMSYAIAAFAAYVALGFARRLYAQDRRMAPIWVFGGALVMGSGIWSMHFVGMLALALPIEVGYRPVTTFVSWLAGVATSAVALSVAARRRPGVPTLAAGAVAMGGGICAMHYTGMAALVLVPGIRWDTTWVAISAAIAIVASAAALLIFIGMRRLAGPRAEVAQVLAALLMGFAISGMHYSGMAAAGFPAGAVCLSANGLGGSSLGLTIAVASVLLMSIGLFTTALDSRLQERARGLTESLKASNEQLAGANAELRRMAFIDPLTGVPNRALFDDRLQHALARVDRIGVEASGFAAMKLAVLFIDLDGFKPINDSYGHAAGDAVLRQVAARLRTQCRDSDTLARIGGDEFVMLLEDVLDEAQAEVAARRIVHVLAQPYEWPGRKASLSCSIGVVVYPDHGHRDRLMASADAAMYAAKHGGGGGYAMFQPHMEHGATETMELQEALREAVANGELHLHYQPKVDSRNGQVHGVEALLRWTHPARGHVPPGVFVPIAERCGLIVPIGNWVIDQACRQIAAWQAQGWRLRVAINLSAHQLRQADIVERLRTSLERHRVDPRLLACEITESVAMEDTLATQHVIERLTSLGVKLSIDDFGTGYSSLASLRQLRAHELKIDRGFVKDVACDVDARALVDAVVRLAHALGLRVVAEGVETAEQKQVLVDLGCDELQGFYFARPMAAGALSGRKVFGDRDGGADDDQAQFAPSVLGEDLTA